MVCFKSRIVAAFLLLSALLGPVLPAAAGAYEDALQGFITDDFSDTAEAIEKLVASGDAKAAPVLQALKDGRLLYSAEAKKVYLKNETDKVTDAETGSAVDKAPDDAEAVRLNNRLRGMLDGVMGSLTLMSPDAARRMDAAQSVYKSRDAGALPALEAALAAEKDARVKRAMQEARAAIVVGSDDAKPEDRVSAILIVRDRGGQDALSMLGSIAADAPPEVRKAAGDAIASIEQRQALWSAVQNAWYGLSLGSVLLLAAIGLAITFGVMGVINMAHGEMVMLGAYVTFVVQELIRSKNPALFDYSLAGLVSAGLLFYLTYALLRPERF